MFFICPDISGNLHCSCMPLQHCLEFTYRSSCQDEVYDLLSPDASLNDPIHIREHPDKGVYLEGVSEFVVQSPAEVNSLLGKVCFTKRSINHRFLSSWIFATQGTKKTSCRRDKNESTFIKISCFMLCFD